MKILLTVMLCLLLVGCATTEYYTNPQNAGYVQQGLGGLCESCNRQFNMSGYQLDNMENITCPYCGVAQNTRMAANRWTYEVRKAQTQANGKATASIVNALTGAAVSIQEAKQQEALNNTLRARAVAQQMSRQSRQTIVTQQPQQLYLQEQQLLKEYKQNIPKTTTTRGTILSDGGDQYNYQSTTTEGY